jgi:hypothetical protein
MYNEKVQLVMMAAATTKHRSIQVALGGLLVNVCNHHCKHPSVTGWTDVTKAGTAFW